MKEMKKLNRFLVFLAALAIFVGVGSIALYEQVEHAQGFVSLPAGFVAPANFLAPATTTGGGLVVTNPASNGIVQVSPGTILCNNGEQQSIGGVQLTLLLNNSYIVVYNCQASALYARFGQVGPGSVTGSPGVPNTVLLPNTGEIGIAQVVCNATACGNGGNGTITSILPTGVLAIGATLGNHPLPTTAPTSDAMGVKAAAGGTMTYTFVQTWLAAPSCVVSDETTADALKAATTTTTLTVTGATTTDNIAWVCFGNPD